MSPRVKWQVKLEKQCAAYWQVSPENILSLPRTAQGFPGSAARLLWDISGTDDPEAISGTDPHCVFIGEASSNLVGQNWVQISALLLSDCVTLGKL